MDKMGCNDRFMVNMTVALAVFTDTFFRDIINAFRGRHEKITCPYLTFNSLATNKDFKICTNDYFDFILLFSLGLEGLLQYCWYIERKYYK